MADDQAALGASRKAIGAPLERGAREERIARLLDGEPPSQFVPYQGGYRRAPVVEVAQDLLVYRAENGRLIAELKEHAREHGLDLADLSARQETQEVQALLHGFLSAKAADPKGPILRELARLAQQTEPLLITADGVLVNGNRRLAAMRELLEQDPDRYASFADVSAAVLPPDISAQDLEHAEAALQLAPETKLAYGWMNRRLKLKRQLVELGLTRETIADAYRMDDPAQLDRELEELALAEDYLDSYCKSPGAYSLIADAEALFVGLDAQLKELPESLRRMWRLAGFSMICGREAVHGPMDRHFPFADPSPGQLPSIALRLFAEENDLVEASPSPGHDTSLPASARGALMTLFADDSRSRIVGPQLFAVMEGLRAEYQDQSSPVRALKLLEKLRQTVALLEPERLTDAQRRKLRNDAAAFQTQVSVLLGQSGGADESKRASPLTRLLGGR